MILSRLTALMAAAAGLWLSASVVAGEPNTTHGAIYLEGLGQGTIVAAPALDFVPNVFADEVVKEAPVSVRITTRSVQELCDGNRIVNEQVVVLYRDGEGRVRREMEGGRRISLYDPVAGESVMLDTRAGHAFRWPTSSGANLTTMAVSIDSATHHMRVAPGADVTGSVSWRGGPPAAVEALGQDTINGVRVEGTAHVTRYAAGTFGNEREIVVRKESWFAPELRLMVRSETVDPRFGRLTYVTDILNVGEPDADLFVVPAGYTEPANDPRNRALPVR